MKIKYLILFLIISIYGCNNSTNEKANISSVEKNDENNLPTIKNTDKRNAKILIYQEENFILEYSENEINKIETLFPILKQKNTVNPEKTYELSGITKNYIDENGKEQTLSFGSEVGQDNFYLIYAYFLKKRNGEIEFKTERETFVNLYRTLNEIYQNLNYGGTYFGHHI